MFEKQNESPHGKCMTLTETIFTKRTLDGDLFVKFCYSELQRKSTVV